MLRILIGSTEEYFLHNQQPFLAALYCALFSTAYFGLFHVAELTSGSHPIMVSNVHIGRNKKKFLFVLKTSKTHGEYNHPQTIKICSAQKRTPTSAINQPYCPYDILWKYSQIWPLYKRANEPFFIFSDNSPVKPIHI